MWSLPSQQLADISRVSPLVILGSGAVSNQASLDLIGLPTGYRCFKLIFEDLLPVLTGNTLVVRVSTDNGATWIAGTAYDYVNAYEKSLGTATTTTPFLNQASMAVAGAGNIISNAHAGWTTSGEITLYAMRDAGQMTRVRAAIDFPDVSAHLHMSRALGRNENLEDHNAFQVLFQTGNISSMNWTLIGVRAS